jgi:hypothetical protein
MSLASARKICQGQLGAVRLLRVGDHDAVEADLHLRDLGDAIAGAEIHLGRLDAAGCVGDVRVLDADTRTEELEPAAGAGALDDGGLVVAGAAELLGHHGGEGIDGG